jgi:hypothetical protein
MVKREARTAIETQKMHMVAALYANSAFDESEEGLKARGERIDTLEEAFDKAITLIYNPHAYDDEKAQEIDWDNPFWAAAKRAQQRRQALLGQVGSEETVQQAVELDSKRAEIRQKAHQEFDQT